MTLKRRQAREWAIQMLSAADINPPSDIDAFITDFWQQLGTLDEVDGGAVRPPAGLRAFAEERVRGVLAKREGIDAKLVTLLDNWDISRLGTVERAVLRMGAWEMDFSDVPKPVVINEAIDLANWFASGKTRHLVNGVLDKYAR